MTDSHSDRIARYVADFVEQRERDRGLTARDFLAATDVPESLEGEVLAACQGYLEVQDLAATDSELPEQSPIGRNLGEYRIDSEIGRGGMGVVYAGYQESLDRAVAVKVLPHYLSLSPRHLEKFRNEAHSVARLDDPRIIKIYGAGTTENGVHYIAMELVEGHTLYDELLALRGEPPRDGGEITPHLDGKGKSADRFRRAAEFVADVAEALGHAHDKQIIHRDIQPRNLLLDASGQPKIIDFGLAKLLDRDSVTRTGEVAGVPYYMSPEQIRAAKAGVDHRTDVYSLGVVLYELLTLRRPFDGSTSQQVLRAIEDRTPIAPSKLDPGLPGALETICLRAIEKDPAKRLSSAAQLATELRRFLAGEPLGIRPPNALERVQRWLEKRRKPILIGAGGVAALAFGWWLARSPTPTATLILSGQSIEGATATIERLEDAELWRYGTSWSLGTVPLRANLPVGHYRIRIQQGSDAWVLLRADLWTAGQEVQVGELANPTTLESARSDTRNPLLPVPSGSARIGTSEAIRWHGQQLRTVEHTEFWIQRYEVSNAEYLEFVRATGSDWPTVWPTAWRTDLPTSAAALPVAGISYADAGKYAAWRGLRLPTGVEWEIAARGREGWLLPWQTTREEASIKTNAVVETNRATRDSKQESAQYQANVERVDSLASGRSPFGLHHVLGNVEEWVDGLALGMVLEPIQVRFGTHTARGGSWANSVQKVGMTLERHILGGGPFHLAGFRCAKSASR